MIFAIRGGSRWCVQWSGVTMKHHAPAKLIGRLFGHPVNLLKSQTQTADILFRQPPNVLISLGNNLSANKAELMDGSV